MPSPVVPHTLWTAAVDLAARAGRTDLSIALRDELAHRNDATAVLCVVGEFKQGKSSFINALVGVDVCPTNVDLATSVVTVVEHGEDTVATVQQRIGDESRSFGVALDTLPEWVTEANNRDNVKRVDRVRVQVPNALLQRGMTLVDTPGVGGLGAGHAAATLGFLPFADALLFVSDASAELSAPEMAFLADAAARCQTVVMLQSKIDLYGTWREIAASNERHLLAAGLDIPVVGVSSALRSAALARRSRTLNDTSGFPALLAHLDDTVLAEIRQRSGDRTTRVLTSAVADIVRVAEVEMAAVGDPHRTAAVVADMTRAKEELDHLRGPAARWQIALNDRWSDMSGRLNHEFRASLRRVTAAVDAELEELTNAEQWDALATRVQTDVGRIVADLFIQLVDEAAVARDAVLRLIRDDHPGVELPAGEGFDLDLDASWVARRPNLAAPSVARRAGRGANEAVDTLRGATGGLTVLSLLQTALPAAGVAVMLANPFLLAGIGIWSGSRTLMEQRKRKLAQQRQQVRLAVTKMVDEVSFEIGDQLAAMLRTLQATLREQLTDRFVQLSRTASELAARTQLSATRTEQATATRLGELTGIVADATALLAAVNPATRRPA